MKYSFLFFLLLPYCLVAQGDWETHISIDGKFKIHTPATLTENIDTITTAIGTLTYHTFFYQPKDQKDFNEMYMVSYVDYPVGAIHSDSVELVKEFFDTTVTAAVEAVKGELRYSSDVDDLDYPGRLWRIDYLEGKAIIKTRAFVVEHRYYSVQTIAFKNKHLNTLTDRFMDSFQLL